VIWLIWLHVGSTVLLHLCDTCPSGNYLKYKATAIGAHSRVGLMLHCVPTLLCDLAGLAHLAER
jgi:hypothetical protein